MIQESLFDDKKEYQKLTFEEIEDAANQIIGGVWLTNRNVQFAKSCWKIFDELGLTKYSNDLERNIVCLRIVALGRIYREFHGINGDEYIEPNYEEWAELLNITGFRLGQLIGMDEDFLNEEDDFANFINAIGYLSDKYRNEVYTALVKGFIGVDSFFYELFKTSLDDEEEYDLDEDESDKTNGTPSFDEVLDDIDIFSTKMKAYSWLSTGCEPYF